MSDSFDLIIVGAGSAGCVLAERLSRKPTTRIAVIEAGGSDRRFWIKLPVGYGRCFHDRRVNWGYFSEPEPTLNGRESYWPRGKVVGGSGSINALVWMRGLPSDFDQWQLPGWRWEDVAPHFAAVESAMGAGRRFPVDVTADCHPVNDRFRAAAQALQERADADFNNPDQPSGFGSYRIATRRGLRRSAADAFLRPALKRPNVTLITGSEVSELVLDGPRVTGVRLDGGRRLHARGAVILSAGAVGTPALLLASGIGPQGNVLANPHVGQNLQDHLAITHYFRASEPTLNNQLHGWAGRSRAAVHYALTRRGPLSLSINQWGGLVRTGRTSQQLDTQLYFTPASYSTDPRTAAGQRAGATRINFDPFPGFLLSAQPCRPTSRGQIRRDADGRLRIEPNSLSTTQDEQAAVDAQRYLQRLLATPSLAALARDCLGPDPRGLDDAALLDDFRARAKTVYHPVGSCALGKATDLDFRLRGSDNLFVVDASLFPIVPSANTNAPTIALAHRAAELFAQANAL